MKLKTTIITICGLTAIAGNSYAGIPVIDYTHVATSQLNQALNYVQYAQEVSQSYTQIQNQVEELKRLGDAGAIFKLTGVDGLYEDLMKTQTVLEGADLEKLLGNIKGDEILGTDLNGLFGEIGKEFKVSGGDTIERDGDLYKPEAAIQKQVAEYRRSKEEIGNRRMELKSKIGEAMADLQGASTEAEVQKQKAVVDALQGELASVESEAIQAASDMEALDIEIDAQKKARAKATAEKDAADLQRAMERDQEIYELDKSKMRWSK